MLGLRDLCKTFPNGTQALSRVSLSIARGEIVALVGGSGCGKTTLLRLVAGLESATDGDVAIDGEVLRGPHAAVGMIFQEPRLLPWLSVAENVAFGLSSLPAATVTRRVNEALIRVGLSGYQSRWPRELSGGQSQRVAIVRALVARPKVLLMDEPFSALDAMTRATLHDHLLGLWASNRPTLLMVTHDVEEAVALADRAIVMQPRPGRLYADIAIDLPRPRDRLSNGFTEAKRAVLAALDGSIAASEAGAKSHAPAGGWW